MNSRVVVTGPFLSWVSSDWLADLRTHYLYLFHFIVTRKTLNVLNVFYFKHLFLENLYSGTLISRSNVDQSISLKILNIQNTFKVTIKALWVLQTLYWRVLY